MTRDDAYALLTKYIANRNLIKHCRACEVTMVALHNKLKISDATEETWGITGLLHDADYEMSKDTPTKHGLMLFEKEQGISEDIKHAIQSHNEMTGVEPKTQMDWAIRCCDQLTGLIVAATLILPDKKLASVTPEFVLKRMKSHSFAKGALREPILMCEEKLGIPLPEFVAITLTVMQGISDEMGL